MILLRGAAISICIEVVRPSRKCLLAIYLNRYQAPDVTTILNNQYNMREEGHATNI